MRPSLDQQCKQTSAIIMASVLDNDHWKAFGYRRRPKRGRLFHSFVSAVKLKQEQVLMQEFWAASFARVYLWTLKRDFRSRAEFVARLMEFCIDGEDEPLWPALRFATAQDATNYLLSACHAYGNRTDSEHPVIFMNRCSSRLSHERPSGWFDGFAWLFTNSNSWIKSIYPALDAAGISENPESDLRIRDQNYLKLALNLFNVRNSADMHQRDLGSRADETRQVSVEGVGQPDLRNMIAMNRSDATRLETVIDQYGAVLEEVGDDGARRYPAGFYPQSLLAHPKELIRDSLEASLRSAKDDEYREMLKVGLVSLDAFIEDAEANRQNNEMLRAYRDIDDLLKKNEGE